MPAASSRARYSSAWTSRRATPEVPEKASGARSISPPESIMRSLPSPCVMRHSVMRPGFSGNSDSSGSLRLEWIVARGSHLGIGHFDRRLAAVPEHDGVAHRIDVDQIGVEHALPGGRLQDQRRDHAEHVGLAASRTPVLVHQRDRAAGGAAVLGEELRPAAHGDAVEAFVLGAILERRIHLQRLARGDLVHLAQVLEVLARGGRRARRRPRRAAP